MEAFPRDAVLFIRVGKGEFGPCLAFAAEGDEGVFDFEFEQFEGLFGGALRFGLCPIGVFIFLVQGVEDGDFGGLEAGECVIRGRAAELGKCKRGEIEQCAGGCTVEVLSVAVGGAFGGAFWVFVTRGDDDRIERDVEFRFSGEFGSGERLFREPFAGDVADEIVADDERLTEGAVSIPSAIDKRGQHDGVFRRDGETGFRDGDLVLNLLVDDLRCFPGLFRWFCVRGWCWCGFVWSHF